MSQAGDRTENWRGGYDGWLTHDRRNDEPDGGRDVFAEPCCICGGNQRDARRFLVCHTATERQEAANARRYRK